MFYSALSAKSADHPRHVHTVHAAHETNSAYSWHGQLLDRWEATTSGMPLFWSVNPVIVLTRRSCAVQITRLASPVHYNSWCWYSSSAAAAAAAAAACANDTCCLRYELVVPGRFSRWPTFSEKSGRKSKPP